MCIGLKECGMRQEDGSIRGAHPFSWTRGKLTQILKKRRVRRRTRQNAGNRTGRRWGICPGTARSELAVQERQECGACSRNSRPTLKLGELADELRRAEGKLTSYTNRATMVTVAQKEAPQEKLPMTNCKNPSAAPKQKRNWIQQEKCVFLATFRNRQRKRKVQFHGATSLSRRKP